MGSSEDNNNNNDDGREMSFEERGETRTGSMFNNKCSSGSGWDPLENYGGSVVVPELGYGLLNHYESGSDLAPNAGAFGNGGFSEMANPFMNLHPESTAQKLSTTHKRKPPHSIFNPNKNGDASGDSPENMNKQDEKKQKTRGHGMSSKAKKDNSDSNGGDYIHVRAKRGQATNSHSLAERVRRERISERMKLLQDLVPGCNKITGKAVMLDEIINYVQSLQHQVEFLSMKLATVNPELNIDIDRIMSKDILNSQGNNSNLGFQHFSQGSLPLIPTTHPLIHPQAVWDNDLHNLVQMGFDPNPGNNKEWVV